jgi:WD40 repeat protein
MQANTTKVHIGEPSLLGYDGKLLASGSKDDSIRLWGVGQRP